MDRNEPAAKRIKIERNSEDSPSSSAVNIADVKQEEERTNKAVVKSNAETTTIKTEGAAAEPSTSKDEPDEPAKPLKLTDLNESCLLDVMSYLDMDDLGAMAEVCVRLKAVAQTAFPIMFGVKIRAESLTIPNDCISTLVKARRLLYNFGHLIPSLTTHVTLWYKKLFKLIRKYCAETIEYVVVEDEPIEVEEFDDYLKDVSKIFLKTGIFSAEIRNRRTIYRNQR